MFLIVNPALWKSKCIFEIRTQLNMLLDDRLIFDQLSFFSKNNLEKTVNN